MSFSINPFFLVASIILFAVGFQVWEDVVGATRALYFALAFWQLGLALGFGGFVVGGHRRD